MSVKLSNAVIRGEKAYTPANDTQVDAGYRDGFYIGGAGDVTFSYEDTPTVKHVKTFAAGDTWFASRIFSIDATGTTATSINILRLAL